MGSVWDSKCSVIWDWIAFLRLLLGF